MISALNNQGLPRFTFHDGAINADKFIEFLQTLIQDVKHKAFLIANNLRAHHAKLVKEWLIDKTESIEIFYLPSYSP